MSYLVDESVDEDVFDSTLFLSIPKGNLSAQFFRVKSAE